MEMPLDTNERLDDLRQKYADVFLAMEQEGLTFSRVQIQDGKMAIQGTAESVEAKERVSRRLAQVDSNWDREVAFDIRTEEQQPHAPNTGQTTVNTAEEFTHGAGEPGPKGTR